MSESNYHRPSWDEYFLDIANMVGSRGSCDRGRLGCVIVRDRRIVATGYVGSPAGIAHCDEIGHEMHTVTHEDGHESRHCIRTIHAEQNAICQAAREGISLEGATIYQKMTPCYTCAKMIINAGIKRVVCQKIYHGSGRTAEIFAETGVQYKILSNELETYADMKPNEISIQGETTKPLETVIDKPVTEDAQRLKDLCAQFGGELNTLKDLMAKKEPETIIPPTSPRADDLVARPPVPSLDKLEEVMQPLPVITPIPEAVTATPPISPSGSFMPIGSILKADLPM